MTPAEVRALWDDRDHRYQLRRFRLDPAATDAVRAWRSAEALEVRDVQLWNEARTWTQPSDRIRGVRP